MIFKCNLSLTVAIKPTLRDLVFPCQGHCYLAYLESVKEGRAVDGEVPADEQEVVLHVLLLYQLAVHLHVAADSLVLIEYLLHPARLVAQLRERHYRLQVEIAKRGHTQARTA